MKSCSAYKYDIGDGYKRIYHYHVRKTAGSSLNTAFWSLAGLDVKSMGRRKIVVERGLKFVHGCRRAIGRGDYFFANSHHAAHSLHLPPETFTVTILRSPVDRVLSFYKYLSWVQSDNHVGKKEPYWKSVFRETKWLGSSFNDFLDRIPREHLMPQLFMFSKNYIVEAAIERAMSCSTVLFTEQFSRGITDLGSRLGIPLKEKHERRFGGPPAPNLKLCESDRLYELLREEIAFIEKMKLMCQRSF